MKHLVPFLSALLLLSVSFSCNPTEKPVTPIVKPNPEPKPDPTPEPGPDPTPEPVESIIYYDNMDKAECSGIWFDQSSSYLNPTGSGISNLTYKSAYAKLTNSFPSSNYPEASGNNGILYNSSSAFIQVSNIQLPKDEKTFKLSVGLYNPNNGNSVVSGKTFKIGITDEKSLSTDFHYLDFKVERFGKWAWATAIFEITSDKTENISIQISSLISQGRSDDLKLVSTTDSPDASISFDYAQSEPSYDFIERPKSNVEKADYKYVDHSATTYHSGKKVRNYEACYDIRRHNPMWVAFPCHEIYQEGGRTRPIVDPWRPDPYFNDGEQSVIYADDWNNWPENTSRYWSGTPDGKYTTRGHLLASSDRGAGNKNSLFELNVQTFYPTNIAPELFLNDTNNGDYDATHWGIVERLRQDQWVCSDTLYIVTGCAYEHENWIVYDDVLGNKQSETSKKCIMPTARYLLALRTKSGTSGKPIWKCSADEVMAIGFWFPQRFNKSTLAKLPSLSEYTFSVSEIEQKIGGEFNFFPLAPQEVKKSYTITDWPGLKAVCED